MTIAELHGKISRTGANLHDQLEDLLTSDVFSTCKYVRPDSLLLPLLKTAKSLQGATLADQIPDTVAGVKYIFWPLLKRSEPDLLLSLKLASGEFILVLVEAKYFSVKSGSALEADQLEIASTPSDQLAREYLDLYEANQRFHHRKAAVISRYLVYITASRLIPETELRESTKEIAHFRASGSVPDLYWTSWFNLHPILAHTQNLMDWEKPLIQDLKQLLERKGLVFFRGFSRLKKSSSITPGSIYQTDMSPNQYRFEIEPVPLISSIYSS